MGLGWEFRAEILTWISSARAIGSAQAGQKPVWERGRGWGWGTTPLTSGYGAGMGLHTRVGSPTAPPPSPGAPTGSCPRRYLAPLRAGAIGCKATVPTTNTAARRHPRQARGLVTASREQTEQEEAPRSPPESPGRPALPGLDPAAAEPGIVITRARLASALAPRA